MSFEVPKIITGIPEISCFKSHYEIYIHFQFARLRPISRNSLKALSEVPQLPLQFIYL